tara:strand:- start:1370 stop:1630 length:261 start_codon:yes stop_codon:yes gene_type:complete
MDNSRGRIWINLLEKSFKKVPLAKGSPPPSSPAASSPTPIVPFVPPSRNDSASLYDLKLKKSSAYVIFFEKPNGSEWTRTQDFTNR